MHAPPLLRPLLTWGALTVVAVLGSLAVIRLLGDGDDAAASATAREPRPEQVAIAVLREWDGRRAAAYAAGEVAALRRLYADGSDAGARDLRVLRSYVARGLSVAGVRQQLLEVRVLDAAPQRLTVRVRDRLADASVQLHDRALPLPQDRPSTNEVVLVRQDGDWRVWSVDRVRPG